jgi:hypothetical protein
VFSQEGVTGLLKACYSFFWTINNEDFSLNAEVKKNSQKPGWSFGF